MASSITPASSASSVSAFTTKTAYFPRRRYHPAAKLSFRLAPRPKLTFFTKDLLPRQNRYTAVKAQPNEVAADGSSDATSPSASKSELPSVEGKDGKLSNKPPPPRFATQDSISELLTQVTSLIKLVDSKDIKELKLKQLDCELVLRKKEALPQPLSPVSMMQPPPSQWFQSPAPVASAPAAAAAPTPPQASSSSPSPPTKPSASSSLPTTNSPMAGTFYRSPAPGEPPFVKVGDKVQKGQMVCIIEAMKLMNEIEADHSGTVVDVLAEDGMPVSVDTPLFVIQP